MRPMILTLLVCLLALAGLSCEKSDVELSQVQPLPENYIRFDDLQVGQRSYYLIAELYIKEGRQQTQYTGDTLVVEITGRDGDLFEVTEKFTVGSPNRDTVISRYCNDVQYGLRVENGVVSYERTFDCLYSRIFGELPGRLPLSANPNVIAEPDGWLVQPFDDGNDDLLLNGYVKGFKLNGVTYPSLLIQVDPSKEPFDGNKNIWIYSAETGMVRFVSYNGFSNSGLLSDLVMVKK